MKKFYFLKTIVLLLCMFMSVGAWADSFNTTYSYGLSGWSLTNYKDQSTYYQVPSEDGPAVATINGIFTGKKITSNVVVTINCATYGSGTNPSSSTFSLYKEKACTNAISATQGGTLPSSSTYTNVTYTISQSNAASLLEDLAIKITKPGKTIRLKSIQVTFTYTTDDGGNSGDGGGDSGDDSGDIGGDDTPAPGSYVYTEVTSQNDICIGGVYLIVCEDEKIAMGSQSANRRNKAAVTISNGKITTNAVNEEGKPFEVTLSKGDNGNYVMTLANGKYLGNGSGSSNNLKEVVNMSSGYQWTLTYSSGSVTMTTDNSTQRSLCVNTNNSSDPFATYTSIGSYKKVTLFKRSSATVAVSQYGYATFFDADHAVTLPEGVTGYVWDNGLVDVYSSNDVVPAGEPLVLKAEEGNYALNHTTSTAETYKSADMNDLCGAATDLDASAMASANPGENYFYALTLNSAGDANSIGFYWRTDGGAAFDIAAGKAYLVLPSPSAPSRFVFADEETAIKAVESTENDVMYNLSGLRVNDNYKGIVIKNGKKVLVK